MSRPPAAIALLLVLGAPVTAAAELPEPFGVPPTATDYRVGYALEGGIWSEGQGTIFHRLALQLPLWGAAAGAVLPFANALGDVNDSVIGNLRLYGQVFRRFAVAPRTALTVGGGLDAYAPTATPYSAQDPLAVLVAGSSAGESTLFAPALSFAVRPRLHVAGELWIFSAQTTAGAAVHFEGSQARVAIEWGAALAASLTDGVALVVEATGISWMLAPPDWMAERTVTLGGGLRFHLPWGWRPGLWVRAPLVDRSTDQGFGTFVGVEILWQHDRSWFLF